MPPLRTVVELLSEQSEDSLRQMLEKVQTELARLTVEAQQIEQALAKKTRRSRTGGGRLTRDQVFEIVREVGRPMTPAEVHDLVVLAGVDATPNAVRNHLTRLADENHSLVRMPDGRFAIPFVPRPEAELLPVDFADDDEEPDFADDDEEEPF